MSDKTLRWLCYGAGGAVLPFAINFMIMISSHWKGWKGVVTLYERGEFFLVAIVLMAAALGDLIASETEYARTKTGVGATTIFLIIMCTAEYAVFFNNLLGDPHYHTILVEIISPIVFVISLPASLACVMLSENV